MKILKVINNNIVSCLDQSGRESIAMGRGLGFGVKPGMSVNVDEVEKMFHLNSEKETMRLTDLLGSIPEEQVELCNRIIVHAAQSLGKLLNPSLYLTLTDHISFAVNRMKQGIVFENALLTEVKTFYPREFAVGKYATDLICREMHVEFPEDEAASIALHLVNAETDTSLNDTMRMTRAMRDILEMLRQSKEVSIREDSCHFNEFTVHLKFLTMQTFAGREEERKDPKFTELIAAACPREYTCARLISDYLEKESHNPVSDETRAYLTIQIHRINAENNKENTKKEG